MDLFEHAARSSSELLPLPELLRPRTLEAIVGQQRLLGPGAPLREAIEVDRLPSMILWGPPGCGKTTLARVIALRTGTRFVSFSAVLGGVKEVRAIVAEAREQRNLYGRKTVLFVDEIHRFNRAQQDAFLPHIEDGTLTLIGATTENPSFELNAALLSRCRVFVLDALGPAALRDLLERALRDERLAARGPVPVFEPEALELLAVAADGDARRALYGLEAALELAGRKGSGSVDGASVAAALQRPTLRHDKGRDEHYALFSAFIKSLRGSDPDAAVYYLVRMLEAGEPPRALCRRMLIFAAEDVGLADPRALQVALSAQQAFEVVGLPEGVLPLTEAALYLACAPKSNAVIRAYAAARKDVHGRGSLPVPAKLRNPVNALARAQRHGADYRYPHDLQGAYSPEHYLPEELRGRRYVELSDEGQEAALGARLSELRARRAAADRVIAERVAAGEQAAEGPAPRRPHPHSGSRGPG